MPYGPYKPENSKYTSGIINGTTFQNLVFKFYKQDDNRMSNIIQEPKGFKEFNLRSLVFR